MAVLSSHVCALYQRHAFTGFVSRHKAQYTDTHACTQMHMHKQTDKLFERGEIESTPLCDSGTTHIANLTLNIFPCVVIILFQFQLSLSRTADNKTRKYRTKNLIFKNQMNISNMPLFCDILIQAFLFRPATGPAWNAWWSWSAWTCWREGQDFFISNYTVCVGSCACVCVVFLSY